MATNLPQKDFIRSLKMGFHICHIPLGKLLALLQRQKVVTLHTSLQSWNNRNNIEALKAKHISFSPGFQQLGVYLHVVICYRNFCDSLLNGAHRNPCTACRNYSHVMDSILVLKTVAIRNVYKKKLNRWNLCLTVDIFR